MPKGYHHLTYDQRCQIYILKASRSSKLKRQTVKNAFYFVNEISARRAYERIKRKKIYILVVCN